MEGTTFNELENVEFGMAYGGNPGGIGTNTLMNQYIPDAKKTDKWVKQNLDVLESIGIRQINDHRWMVVLENMIGGHVEPIDILSANSNFSEVERLRGELDLETEVKHYDILGEAENILAAHRQDFLYTVRATDEYSSNEFNRNQTEKLMKGVDARIKTYLDSLPVPGQPQQAPKNEQEAAAMQQQQAKIQQQQQESIPKFLKNLKTKDFKTTAALWAQETLAEDEERFYENEYDDELFRHYLRFGRMFLHYRVGASQYSMETWHPKTVFFSQTPSLKYTHKEDFTGRIMYMESSAVINNYHHLMTTEETERLGKLSNGSFGEVDLQEDASNEDMLHSKFSQTHLVPFKGYSNYLQHRRIQELTGVPMGVDTSIDSEGNTVHTDKYLPEQFGNQGLGSLNFDVQQWRPDLELRTDLTQVTEVYWKSTVEMAYIHMEDERGVSEYKLVKVRDLDKNFFKTFKIKKLRKHTLAEMYEDPKPNTALIYYKPEYRFGVKINCAHTSMGKDLYLEGGPLPYQVRDNINPHDVVCPVVGFVGNSPLRKGMEYQIGYDLHMNRGFDLTEKDLGKLLLADVNMLTPSLKEDMGDDPDEMLLETRDTAKDTGMVAVDGSRGNIQNLTNQNAPFNVVNLSLIADIQQSMLMADAFEAKTLKSIGIHPSLAFGAVEQTTATGVKQNTSVAYAQIQNYYDTFDNFKVRSKDVHLAIAQFAQMYNKDAQFGTSRDFASQAYIQMAKAEDLGLWQFGIKATNSKKDKKDLEDLRTYILSNNTHKGSNLDVMRYVTSDSVIELLEAGREAEEKIAARMQQEQEAMQSNTQAKKDAEKELIAYKAELAEKTAALDRIHDLKVKGVAAMEAQRAGIPQATLDPNSVYKTQMSAKLGLQKLNQEAAHHQDKMGMARAGLETRQAETRTTAKERAADRDLRAQSIAKDRFVAVVNK